jgi:hypothetical protein
MFGLIPVRVPLLTIVRVLVLAWMVVPVMIVLSHCAHLTLLAQGSA